MEVNHALRRVFVGTAVAAVICSGVAWATAGSGTSSTLVGPPATFEPFNGDDGYTFRDLPPDINVRLRASKDGYRSKEMTVLATSGAYTQSNFELETNLGRLS